MQTSLQTYTLWAWPPACCPCIAPFRINRGCACMHSRRWINLLPLQTGSHIFKHKHTYAYMYTHTHMHAQAGHVAPLLSRVAPTLRHLAAATSSLTIHANSALRRHLQRSTAQQGRGGTEGAQQQQILHTLQVFCWPASVQIVEISRMGLGSCCWYGVLGCFFALHKKK